ncbi:MAG: hypothetical protein AAFZ52_09985, partial [Bacteroidota bacterium]
METPLYQGNRKMEGEHPDEVLWAEMPPRKYSARRTSSVAGDSSSDCPGPFTPLLPSTFFPLLLVTTFAPPITATMSQFLYLFVVIFAVFGISFVLINLR